MKIKNILGQSAFWMVNKEIAKHVGVEAALFLSYMIDKADNLPKKERDGMQWFYRTSEDIENETTLSYRVQKSCLKRLSDNGMMYAKLMGTPRKLYFTICESNILQNDNAIVNKSATIELTKAQLSYNEKPNNEKPINKDIDSTPDGSTSKHFKKWSNEDFINDLKKFTDKVPREDLNNFYNFWSESDGKKMRFQHQATWQTKNRLTTWMNKKAQYEKSDFNKTGGGKNRNTI